MNIAVLFTGGTIGSTLAGDCLLYTSSDRRNDINGCDPKFFRIGRYFTGIVSDGSGQLFLGHSDHHGSEPVSYTHLGHACRVCVETVGDRRMETSVVCSNGSIAVSRQF